MTFNAGPGSSGPSAETVEPKSSTCAYAWLIMRHMARARIEGERKRRVAGGSNCAAEVLAITDDRAKRLRQVVDYITGQPVRWTPEEVDAVQVISRRLVEDYGYDKSEIQTHPQYRVRVRPSDQTRTFPVDVAVFNSARKTEDELRIVVECKKKERTDGEHQLRLYMDMSAAEIGVWFNGNDHIYLRKVHHKNGRRTYESIPSIPRKGQRIEDIGLYSRADLRKPSSLKAVFRDVRNHLAGMATGITRDEAFAQQIINLLFCKLLDEIETENNDTVTFRVGVDESPSQVRARIEHLFMRVKAAQYGDVFTASDEIKLDDNSLSYVVGELQPYCLMDADRDAIGDAFEVFIGPALKGPEGQFFTPRNAVELIVKLIDPSPGERVIDPACGSGGFLIAALAHVWERIRAEGKRKGWTATRLARREIEVASTCFYGIDKDEFLSKVSKAYMALIGDGRGGVFCANSLARPDEWPADLRGCVKPGTFDVVLTNPPFGVNIKIEGDRLLAQYELARRWTAHDGVFARTQELVEHESPQVLFIERCVALLKPGGRLGIVLPEGILGNKSSGHIIDFLRSKGTIVALVDITRTLFQPHTDTKTNIVIFRKHNGRAAADRDNSIFLAVAKTCGHDRRGNQVLNVDGTINDELPVISDVYTNGLKGRSTRLGFRVPCDRIEPYYLIPRYYSPEVQEEIVRFAKQTSAELVTIQQLIDDGILSVSRGHEVGSVAYGTGDVPFIRTSDISNMEIRHDPTFGVSEEIYEEYAIRQDLRPFDILFVNDGRYRIGQVCMLSEYDTRIVIQSHLRVLRSLDHKKLDPFLLLYLLKHPVVQLQIQSKTFIQSTIATIGQRIKEIVLPLPKDLKAIAMTIMQLRRIITERAKLRDEARQINDAMSSQEGVSI